MEFKAGRYYVGDLCYVLGGVWDGVCAHLGEDIFTLKDGRKCSMFSTKYGDGLYRDEDNNEYCVDSGTIGCVLMENEDVGVFEDGIGMIFDFKDDFNVSENGGFITIGDVVIDTEGWDEEL